jgi:hypothetical protein
VCGNETNIFCMTLAYTLLQSCIITRIFPELGAVLLTLSTWKDSQQRDTPNLWPMMLNSDGQWLDPAEVSWALGGGFEFGTNALV